ncbi:bacteriocin immunity protein [Pseudomonas sp. RGM 3321]|uniref:bacteriocin immunity protein n=1 Tax=Pseudomonas sp. RGM 3321 TaxID=2930089 RepID=UPI001FCADCE9|nr:bacteriocin immunity protein [Pseudomonas sp. RGM 3321]MCJ2371458.1 bacteriocin immunity protein [Pseudomonas sp. RGM 3321]
MSNNINDMTELEFLLFVKNISEANYPSESAHNDAVISFEEISEHPAGSDLLFYPEQGKESPEAIVAEVKAWRAANSKTGFKTP